MPGGHWRKSGCKSQKSDSSSERKVDEQKGTEKGVKNWHKKATKKLGTQEEEAKKKKHLASGGVGNDRSSKDHKKRGNDGRPTKNAEKLPRKKWAQKPDKNWRH